MPQLKTHNSSQDTRTVSSNRTKRQSEEETETTNKWRNHDDGAGDFTVERDQNVSGAFNYERRAIADGGAGGVCAKLDIIVSRRPELDHSIILIGDRVVNGARDSSREHTYENINFDGSSKELLLHKFFHSADGGDAIYENLCRGCGYGVFAAHGEFCYFCSSILNGVGETAASIGSLGSDENLVNNNNSSVNVYENICENCYAIYSSDECVNCEKSKTSSLNRKSEEIIQKNSKVKLGKSKSFNKKSEKRSIFQGFFGSLKRSPKAVKTTGNSNSSGRLEIIHNVDGYENVFRTQETFDLQRICELKRTLSSSNSEQHIYGRVKCTEEVKRSQSSATLPRVQIETNGYSNSPIGTLSQSSLREEEESSLKRKGKNSTLTAARELVAKAYRSGKRPRISKPRLLHPRTSAEGGVGGGEEEAAINDGLHERKAKAAVEKEEQQAIYLPDSVCHWMRALRREVHNYSSCSGDDEDETIGLCSPKSIPAKNSLLSYNRKVVGGDFSLLVDHFGAINDFSLTNNSNIEQTSTRKVRNSEISLDEKLHSRNSLNGDVERRRSSAGSSSSCCDDQTVTLREQREFLNYDSSDSSSSFSPVALSRMVNEFKRSLVNKQHKKKQQMSKAATLEAQPKQRGSCKNDTEKSKVNRLAAESEHSKVASFKRELRARRQGIYLKADHDERERGPSESNKKNLRTSADNCSNNNNKFGTDEKESMIKKSTDLLDSTNFGESPVSRRRAAQGNGDTLNNNRKRCGIYEPSVVSDILSEFDTFLQREEDSIVANECTESQQTEEEEKEEQSPTNDPSLIAASSSLSALSGDDLATPPYAEQRDQQRNHPQQLVQRNCPTTASIDQLFDVVRLTESLHLSRGLNRVIIGYQQPLRAFLLAIRERYPRAYKNSAQAHLIQKFLRFNSYCVKRRSNVKLRPKKCIERKGEVDQNRNQINGEPENVMASSFSSSSSVVGDSDGDGALKAKAERNSVKIIVQQLEVNYGEKSKSKPKPLNSIGEVKNQQQRKSEVLENKSENSNSNSSATNDEASSAVENVEATKKKSEIPLKPHCSAPKKPEKPPPQVPLRDPKTVLSAANKGTPPPPPPPPLPPPTKRESPKNNRKMTIPSKNTNATDESIYQPIWKFKTVGEAQERYQTDADYYEIGGDDEAKTGKDNNHGDSLSLISMINEEEEDHGEWETDDEFMFTTEMLSEKSSPDAEVNSLSSSISAMQSTSNSCGSTVAGFSSSTATLASAISSSLSHHLFRNIGIFYSLTEPKLRAIIYDYDRVHASAYFAKRSHQQQQQHEQQQQHQQQQQPQQQPHHLPPSNSPCAFDSLDSNANDSGLGKSPKEERSPKPPPRTSSANFPKKCSESGCLATTKTKTPPTMSSGSQTKSEPLLPDSVQAWKFMLLDVNYLEDEEDMIVSEEEIVRSQNCKEDNDARQTQQLNILQRFKSASFGNLVDLPNEDDKKSIAERMRNKLQRGVFKLNVRSPKSDKKNRGVFRRAEATSLYLEDGMKPKYPIFGAPLDQLELDECTHLNVPRFVVDCVAYIEQKDCITQEGLYRASGNKVSIEDLKQKLSESYIYDPKLLVIDDIHTLTSLLKLFFRELGAPLIPQETYEKLGRNLSDSAAIETMRDAFEEMREPNRSTLKFLIRHLTNVAACSYENRMPASNLAIVWGPCIMSANQIEFDIGRMNTLAKVLIENYARIFNESERLVA